MCNQNLKVRLLSFLLSVICLCMAVIPAGADEVTVPAYWRNGLAPDYFWDKIEEIVAGQDVATLLKQWEEEYGEESYWPLEYYAIWCLWVFLPKIPSVKDDIDFSPEALPRTLYGFPADEDIPREKAVDIAQKAFFAACEGIYDQTYAESLDVRVSFIFNLYGYGSRTWIILFDEAEGVTPGVVKIDAETGEVVDCHVGGGVG